MNVWWIVIPVIVGTILLGLIIVYFAMRSRAKKYVEKKNNIDKKK